MKKILNFSGDNFFETSLSRMILISTVIYVFVFNMKLFSVFFEFFSSLSSGIDTLINFALFVFCLTGVF
jgi:hypothetical protein